MRQVAVARGDDAHHQQADDDEESRLVLEQAKSRAPILDVSKTEKSPITGYPHRERTSFRSSSFSANRLVV